MAMLMHAGPAARLTLRAESAADLMTPNPISLRDGATVREAVALLTDRGFRAAPVIDEAGRPVGVLSQSDILVHDRERGQAVPLLPECPPTVPRTADEGDATRVSDLMTPGVFSVPPEWPAAMVVEEMLALKVHRLFVVDHDGVLVGVISANDILRHLRP